MCISVYLWKRKKQNQDPKLRKNWSKQLADIQTIAENMPQDRSVISRHLNLMQEAGILTCEKENRHMFYNVNGQPFIEKLVDITEKIRKCMNECCPDCCK